jgi:hypothetical protein
MKKREGRRIAGLESVFYPGGIRVKAATKILPSLTIKYDSTSLKHLVLIGANVKITNFDRRRPVKLLGIGDAGGSLEVSIAQSGNFGLEENYPLKTLRFPGADSVDYPADNSETESFAVLLSAGYYKVAMVYSGESVGDFEIQTSNGSWYFGISDTEEGTVGNPIITPEPLQVLPSIPLTPAFSPTIVSVPTKDLRIAWNETPAGAVDGYNREFLLMKVPTLSRFLQLFMNGQLLMEGVGNDYQLEENKVVMQRVPLVGDQLLATYQY